MINQLELSSCERKILMSLNLPGTLADISKRLSTPRSTIEYNVKKLFDQKLITYSLYKKRKIYNLVIKNDLQKSTTLSPITKIGPITIYTGVKAIETLWREVSQERRESRIVGIQPRRSFREAIRKSSKDTVSGVSQSITNKRFIVDSIIHDELVKSLVDQYEDKEAKLIAKSFTGRLEDIVKVDRDFLDEKSEMFIIGNYSFFIDWYKEIAIKIENQNINHLLLSLYQAAKAYGKRYNQGEDIKNTIGKI